MSVKKFAASILKAEASSPTSGGHELFGIGEYDVHYEGASANDDQTYAFLAFSMVDDPTGPRKHNMYSMGGVSGRISAADIKACMCALFDVTDDEFLPFLLGQKVDPQEAMCAFMGVSENKTPKEKAAVEFINGYTGPEAGCPIHVSVRKGKENPKKPGEHFSIVKYSTIKE